MAVGANHLASCDLGVQRLARCRLRHQRGDARHLHADVIELEDNGIALAAIDAWVLEQVLEHPCTQGRLPRLLGGVRLAPMRVTPISEVGGEARPAPPLQPVAVPVEALDREIVATSAAMAERSRPPYAQAPDRYGVQRSGGRARRRRRLYAAYPHEDFATPSSRAMRASDQPRSRRIRNASCLALSFLRTNIGSHLSRM